MLSGKSVGKQTIWQRYFFVICQILLGRERIDIVLWELFSTTVHTGKIDRFIISDCSFDQGWKTSDQIIPIQMQFGYIFRMPIIMNDRYSVIWI